MFLEVFRTRVLKRTEAWYCMIYKNWKNNNNYLLYNDCNLIVIKDIIIIWII